MAAIDQAVLARIMTRLPADEALVLSAAVEDRWRARQRRLDIRDAAIRQELASATTASLTAAATTLERRLRRAAAGNASADEVAFQLLELNDRKVVGWKQLSRIARAGRTDELRINSDGNGQLASADSKS